ncbi:MAG: RNA-binding protein [Elusimicrobia bacterium]|jgi:RNA recognition motif-containing protein|nr:RNA-binding protein [Elusimicrobiota bacterium]
MEEKHKLYIGNLNYETTEDELKDFFNEKGIETKSVMLITDKYTGRPKGFGFVEVESDEMLQQAVDALNGQELNGRKLTVNKANPPREKTGYSGGGFKDRGGFGGGRKGGFRDRKPRY